MKRLLYPHQRPLNWLIAILLSFGLCSAQTTSGDEAAIRDLVKKYLDARDRNDSKGVESLFTADADQLVSSGEWRRGRDEVVRGTLASSQSNVGKRTIEIETIRFILPGAAIVDGRYDLGIRRMWSTFVMAKTPGGWRIAAIRNMLPAPAATGR